MITLKFDVLNIYVAFYWCDHFWLMEFVEYIKSPRVDNVYLKRRGLAYLEGTLCVTGHHLIFSSRTEHKDELIVSHLLITIARKSFSYELIELLEKITKYSESNLWSG